MASILAAGAGITVFAATAKDVVIYDNGKTITCKTMKKTVLGVLDQNDIAVSQYDYVNVSMDSKLQTTGTNLITIKRAVPVYITADGKQTQVMTWKNTVGEMLKESPVKPADLDRLEGAALTDKITADMSMRIIRVREAVVNENETIPYTVQRNANADLDQGVERVAAAGQEGIRRNQYQVVTEDGNEVSRQLLATTILKSPIAMVLEFGTMLSYKTSRGDTLRYDKVLDMKATAYTASFKDTGKNPGDPGFGITATGLKVRKGIIAVDPRVIPLGTRVYVEVESRTPDYGYAVAADVGGAIKGNRIDLYFDDAESANRFGVKSVKVFILSKD